MLDPLSAIGLASSLVQFLDFAGKLLSSSYSAYKSIDGATNENRQLESVIQDVRSWSESLSNLPSPTSAHVSADERALQDLREECQRLAQELLSTLQSLKVKQDTPFRSLAVVGQSIRTAYKSDKIKKLEKDLAKIRAQINARLISITRNEQSSVMRTLEQLADKSKRMHIENRDLLNSSKEELLAALRQQEYFLKEVRSASIHSRILQASANENLRKSIAELSSKLEQLRTASAAVATTQSILESLLFPEMQMRFSSIHKAYEGTFSWIFKEKSTTFKTWLETSNGTFWIAGKAGSGKSTLMKFITGHSQTTELLKKWSGNQEIVTASYYFWSAGYPIQKSQEGLLQSLLFQILRKCPDLIPIVAPRRWQADEFFHDHPDPWTREELSSAIDTVLQHGRLKARFCFFIDGLDEYAGDHDLLIKDLQHFVKASDVKLCVSSRPWNAFRTAYGGFPDKSFMVQDLTREDMRLFIKGMLEDDTRFQKLAQSNGRVPELVAEIEDRARGVFLWVYLVVRSLRRGLTEEDDIAMLQKRLRQLPTDLENYFRHMIDSIEKVYAEYTTRTLLIVVEASHPLPAIVFWYLARDLDDPDLVKKLPIKPVQSEDLKRRIKHIGVCINKWCRDLLEINIDSSSSTIGDVANSFKVEFLHRTVKDFLLTNEMRELLQSKANPDFNPRLTLCRLLIAQTKGLDLDERWWSTEGKQFNAIAAYAMAYATKCEVRDGLDMTDLVLELDKVGIHHYGRRSGHWSYFLLNERNERLWIASQASLLTYATNLGLRSLVHKAICTHKAGLDVGEASALLDCALRPIYRHAAPFDEKQPPYELVKLLLEHGADPNHTVGHNLQSDTTYTVWELFLEQCASDTETVYRTSNLVPLVRLLLHHGAKSDAIRARDDQSTVLQCLEAMCSGNDLDELREILKPARAVKSRWLPWRISWVR